ncbi:DUF559 domain-containing protein [Gordonia sp. MMO-8]|uniref:DUF559 domain-containing protein n=1 Tax=Gordonia sp. MMO-8 TaxID=3127886 RepID=UPI003FA52EB7
MRSLSTTWRRSADSDSAPWGSTSNPRCTSTEWDLLDLLVEGRVIVELDGRQHRDDSAQYTKDRRRDRVAQLGDYLILRLDSTDVFARWRGAERDVRRLVELTAAHRSA